ncbi:hypothetical protein L518_1700 [Bordetella bronchiseptica MBORD675]|uniref:hypothetical protein n=1 Tax=Bordetella bronchiseptica TaxID=518 RepID=UPI00028F5F9C|nr:hypothetical protein [Bordetella bronchiseptica]KDC96037.1 hypothetical protein L518_1700 [Bordetella bronchiseptica MBORD675]QIX99298.1 hypothetical protein FOC01_04085 [Bordetella bronchiseptica]CCN05288.1 hypothetical protein BN116_3496 [Bordetella bronchiseptica Bbr77]
MFAIPTNRVRAVRAALRLGSVRTRLQEQGARPSGNALEPFKAFMADEARKRAQVVRQSGATVD